MSGVRAAKSGLAAEAQNKINSKYDEALAGQVMTWVNERITSVGEPAVNTSGAPANVYQTLKDGYVLCSLMKAVEPTSNIKFKKEKMAFKQMECISMFLNAVEKYGVSRTELFQTCELYEEQNLNQVVMCIFALGRKVSAKGGPGMGPKEAERQSREWTEEQLKAGQNVIGLQMGSNKGATQSGQTFGKQRMIID